MGGANHYRNSSSKRVKVNICGPFPSFYQNLCSYIPRFVCSGTMVIELREFNYKKKKKNKKKKKKKKNNMDKMQKFNFVIIKPKSGTVI